MRTYYLKYMISATVPQSNGTKGASSSKQGSILSRGWVCSREWFTVQIRISDLYMRGCFYSLRLGARARERAAGASLAPRLQLVDTAGRVVPRLARALDRSRTMEAASFYEESMLSIWVFGDLWSGSFPLGGPGARGEPVILKQGLCCQWWSGLYGTFG